jgi:anti-sigma factor RsiW
MTACPDRILHLHALFDGELDAVNSLATEAHVETCAGCAAELRRLEEIHGLLATPGVSPPAPEALRNRIDALLAEQTEPAPSARPAVAPGLRTAGVGGRTVIGAALALAASLALVFAVPQFTIAGVQDQLVASHVRSLLASHLTDVATSDRHVVKPWFNGRIDFSPPVVELAPQGFPLVGGRLDYVEGKVVPALVYRRRLHTINLFIRPAGRLPATDRTVRRRDGYSLVRWTRGGLEFWAVSDVEPADLEAFRQVFIDHTAP